MLSKLKHVKHVKQLKELGVDLRFVYRVCLRFVYGLFTVCLRFDYGVYHEISSTFV